MMNDSNRLSTDEVEAERMARELTKLIEELTVQDDKWRLGGEAAGLANGEEDVPRAAQAGSGATPISALLGAGILKDLSAEGNESPAGYRGGAGPAGTMTLGPVWAGLLSLFDASDVDREPMVFRYEPPAEQIWEMGYRSTRGAELFATDRDAAGMPRPWMSAVNPAPSATPAPVRVEIHALDSRSILDRSDDLAEAVRRAISESHRLNDYLVEE